MTGHRILAIDPGSTESALVVWDGLYGVVRWHGIQDNHDVLFNLRTSPAFGTLDVVVTEFMSPRGMPTSAEEMEALWWAGRFHQAVLDAEPGLKAVRVLRKDVKLTICGTVKANDANIRAALIDRFGGIGGKAVAVGLKAKPGPLYGIREDEWQALGLALTYAEKLDEVAV